MAVAPLPDDKSADDKTRQQPEQQQVSLRIDERNMRTGYANAFRSNGTAEEVMLDFGVNIFVPPQQQGGQPEMILQVNERVIMNYYSAKRLALALTQVIRQHEEQFGDLELDVNRRRKGGG